MGRTAKGPALSFKRKVTGSWKGNLDVEIIEMLNNYVAFHQQNHPAPHPETAEEIIEAAIGDTIGEESAFLKYLKDRRSGRSTASTSNAAAGASESSDTASSGARKGGTGPGDKKD